MESSKYNYKLSEVKENLEICTGIYKLVVKGDFKGKPGQFFMLRCWGEEPILWRPISIHSVNEDSIEFLYQVVGKGTELLTRLRERDEIQLIGPLGNGFNIENIKGKIAVVTGGIGIAPMQYVISSLSECEVDFYGGFRNDVYCVDELKPLVNKINITTEDGSSGHKGYVTEILNTEKYDMVLCCGPEVMMKKVLKMCKDTNTKVFISEEKKMACGVGACLVCTCKTIHGHKRTCKDGPVFSGEELEV
jgi:dihydroorotate dehydrogenase electron transfer subunit